MPPIHKKKPTDQARKLDTIGFCFCFGAKKGQNLNELVPEQIFQIQTNSNCVAEIIQMKLIIVK